jgi:hypothetical protein
MTTAWTDEEFARIADARELSIAVERADGALRSETPIWVVTVDGEVYVRTWYRRETGWFGAAIRSRRARIHVPGVELPVTVDDIGRTDLQLGDRIDHAYRNTYGGSDSAAVQQMCSAEAAATTLCLRPRR